MFGVLNQSYPGPTPGMRSIMTALIFGLFISLFLFFFEPFGIDLVNYNNKTIALLSFGAITTLVLVIFLHLLPMLFSKIFSDDHWKVKHQILFYILIFLVIATLNGLYTNYVKELNFNWTNYWWIISRTFILGGIPISFLTIFDYNKKLNRHLNEAEFILSNRRSKKGSFETEILKISTELKKEVIDFDKNTFLYAQAVGNYIDLFIINDDIVKKNTYRISLSSFEKHVNATGIERCHRSYFVNLDKVDHISGNAQGLKLRFPHHKRTIPVSRKYISIIKEYFSQTT